MKIPLSWLKEFISVPLSPSEIGKLLTMAGIEVDCIDTLPLPFQGIVVGKVLDVKKHPDAEKLVIATVTDGLEYFQVVCGAPNCRKGLKTAFAKIGASLVDETGQSVKIKKSKLRGVESCGMLCSGKELGLSTDADGIIEFPEKYPEGKDLTDLFSDAIFEISLTPNLNHCASVLGIARELSALTAHVVHLSHPRPHEDPSLNIENEISLRVEDSKNCPRYACRLIKGVKVGPSPAWLQQRLMSIGMRSVNNVVDATNFVLMELGHPLHAFDYDLIEGKQIVVKSGLQDLRFTTLDHEHRQFSETSLMICDAKKPLAFAGIMGSLEGEVTSKTVNVLIESAYFKPSSIRKTSKEQGLLSESSKRFEKCADPQQVLLSLDRVTALIQELAGGNVATGTIDFKAHPFNPKTITCRLSRINQILGTQLALSEVETIFQRLQCRVAYEGQNVLHVQVPTYRADLNSEVDLIEEIARIYGYNHIPKPPSRHQSSTLGHAPIFLFERDIRNRLISQGLQEFLTCDLINPSVIQRIFEEHIQPQTIVHIVNPNSVDQSALRPSLLPGLLELVKYNFDHKNEDLIGFEVGRIHFKDEDQFKEQSMVGIVLTGKSRPSHWDRKPAPLDFFDLKGMIESLLSTLGITHHNLAASTLNSFHPWRQASIHVDALRIGIVGELHPSLLREMDIPQRVFYAELNLHDMFQVKKPSPLMHDLPQFPGSERDWTISIPTHLAIEEFFNSINSVRSYLLESVSLIDVHQSEKLGPETKNITFHFVYRDVAKTLSYEEVEAEHSRIIHGTLAKLQREGKLVV